MTGNNNTHKLRAVLLAALMVFSVFAGTVAFAGSASANVASGGSTSDVSVGQSSTSTTITGIDVQQTGTATVDISALADAGVDLSSAGATTSDSTATTGTPSVDASNEEVTVDVSSTGTFDLTLNSLDTVPAEPATGLTYTVTASDGDSADSGTFAITSSASVDLQTQDISSSNLNSDDEATAVTVAGFSTNDVSGSAAPSTQFLAISNSDGDIVAAVDTSTLSGSSDTVSLDTPVETDQTLTASIHPGDGSGNALVDTIYASDEGDIFRSGDFDAETTASFDGTTFFQGQEVRFNLGSGNAGQITLERVTSRNDAGEPSSTQFALQRQTSDDGTVIIDTSNLQAGEDYVIQDPSGTYVPGGTALNTANEFGIVEQGVTVEFDDDEVTNEGPNAETEVDIDSARSTFDLLVTTDGNLDENELTSIFNTVGDGASVEDAADNEIRISNAEGDGQTVDFQDIDPDTYDFDFEVADTGVTTNDSITVTEDDVDASFGQSSYSQTAGDVVEMNISLEDTDDAFVQIGDEDSGFVDVLYIEDDDDDDEVTFEVNTRTLGTGAPIDVVYNSEDDIVESAMHGGISTPDTVPVYQDSDGNALAAQTSGTSDGFTAYLDQLGLIDADTDSKTDQLIRPVQPTTYDVAVNGNNVFVSNDDDEAELDDELDLATLDLTQPGVDNVQTWTAPADNADEDDEISEVLDSVTQSGEVAEGDRLVIQAEATGIYGHLVQINGDFDALDDGITANQLGDLVDTDSSGSDARNGEGVSLTVEADDSTGNQQATELNLNGPNVDNQDIFVLLDNENGQMFIVVDTSSSEAFTSDIDADADFEADLTYETDDSERFEFSSSGSVLGSAGGAPAATGDEAFPYFQADSDQSQSADVTIAEESVSFDGQNADSQVQLANTDSATVSGTTNIAPGSDATIRVRSDSDVSPSFVKTVNTDIADDGSFNGTFDFTEQSTGDTADVSLRVSGSVVDESADGIVVESVSTETATPEPDTDTATAEPDTDTAMPDTDTPTSTPTSTPGFGIVVALTALLAAALLAVRRNN